MVLGMSIETFTLLHVVISLVGIAAGFVAMFGWVGGKERGGVTAIFLAATLITTFTGFLFPFREVTPGHIFGVLTLIALPLAMVARYVRHLAGGWRKVYVFGSAFAQYLNVFVLVVQSFQKAPVLNALAPTGAEPPFFVAQLVVLIGFLILGRAAVINFKGSGANGEGRTPMGFPAGT